MCVGGMQVAGGFFLQRQNLYKTGTLCLGKEGCLDLDHFISPQRPSLRQRFSGSFVLVSWRTLKILFIADLWHLPLLFWDFYLFSISCHLLLLLFSFILFFSISFLRPIVPVCFLYFISFTVSVTFFVLQILWNFVSFQHFIVFCKFSVVFNQVQ